MWPPVRLRCQVSLIKKCIGEAKCKRNKLELLEKNDREQFIIDNQISFKYGALVEFGKRDDHLDDDGEIISRETIEKCIDDPDNVAYRIV